jgi:2-methylcitrate dehydratase PrpD
MNPPPTSGVTETLAAFVAQLRYEQLPADVANEAKLAIADTIGSALAAANETVTLAALSTIESDGPASVWGLGRKASARDAAFVNGTMAHAHDVDDTNPSMRGHPSCPVVPVVFALGAQQRASGKDLIAAYIAGVEVETKVGRAVNMAHYNKGWHTTLTLGSLGAAAAAAKLLKLDARQTANALAIAASTAGGLVANFGTMTKPVHSGFAADNGVKAALLARAGITANPKALEAKTGFFELFVGAEVRPELALEKLGERWDIVDPGHIYKLYPTCSLTHCAVDMLLDGIKSGEIRPAEVEAIECAVGYRCENTLPYHDAKTGLEGKFSMEYCLAAALVYGKLGFAEFTDEAVNAPAIGAMQKRIRLYTHPDLRTPESVPFDFTDITVVHRDGRKFHGRESHAKGDPHKRWSMAQFKGKFVECAEPVLGDAQAGSLWERVQLLETLSGEQAPGLV